MSLQAHFLRIAYAIYQLSDYGSDPRGSSPPSLYLVHTLILLVAYTYSTESVSEAYSYKGSLSLDGRKGRCIQCASFKGG